jgi:[ribosomal protein S5]-alanine N-acetyltransferase
METPKTYFLEGNTIYLREVRLSDVNDNYYNWLNNPSVNQFLETRFFPRSHKNIEQFVQYMDGKNDEILMAVCTKNDNTHIGNIKIGPINWVHRFADISLLIGDKRYWGKGIATEAIKLMTNFGFKKLNLHKLKAGCYADNKGSEKAFLKVGYSVEGVLKQHFFSEGKYVDTILLAIINEPSAINE